MFFFFEMFIAVFFLNYFCFFSFCFSSLEKAFWILFFFNGFDLSCDHIEATQGRYGRPRSTGKEAQLSHLEKKVERTPSPK